MLCHVGLHQVKTKRLGGFWPRRCRSRSSSGHWGGRSGFPEVGDRALIDRPVSFRGGPSHLFLQPPAKWHGRNGADAYSGGRRVAVPHGSLYPGNPCPQAGCEGKLYRLPEPRILVCVKGHVPLETTLYEREALRCALCGKVFVAGLPEGVHDCKYDPTATGMIGLLKYGTGMPFYRLEGLQSGEPADSSSGRDAVGSRPGRGDPMAKKSWRNTAKGLRRGCMLGDHLGHVLDSSLA
jgi:hypothetical protein